MKKTGGTSIALFKKKSLSERVADSLRESIQRGTWKKCLPPERSLCLRVEASRPVVRKALHLLAGEGLVKLTTGHPARVINSAIGKDIPAKPKHVVLLVGRSLQTFGNSQTIFVEELRQRLLSEGFSFEVVVDLRLPQKKVSHFLEELTEKHEADFWILSSVTLAVQTWFEKQGMPTVIDGSSFPEISLPSVDVDHRAIGRHAAGVLLRLGHRRIVSFIRSNEAAGDQEMKQGFLEAFKAYKNSFPQVILHPENVAALRSRLKSLIAQESRPTAIVVSNAFDFLVVMTGLLEWGIRIPKDLSLVVLHPDTFMNQLTPFPAHYDVDSIKQAQAVCRLIKNSNYRGGRIRQIPSFKMGGSLAAPSE